MKERQLSIFECSDAVPHTFDGIHANSDGYRSHCACGWQCETADTKQLAQNRWQSHLRTTPAVARVLDGVRRPGRFSHV